MQVTLLEEVSVFDATPLVPVAAADIVYTQVPVVPCVTDHVLDCLLLCCIPVMLF